ncbi:hypothetical protein Bbelb_030920 [Branchiostoma belcheri]|nr:hypothetical protein Bbelb_030920 [Branchiostoma belcheri]
MPDLRLRKPQSVTERADQSCSRSSVLPLSRRSRPKTPEPEALASPGTAIPRADALLLTRASPIGRGRIVGMPSSSTQRDGLDTRAAPLDGTAAERLRLSERQLYI